MQRKTNKGRVYDISLEEFKTKIMLFYPDYFTSLTSLTSLNREEKDSIVVMNGDDNTLKVTEMSLDTNKIDRKTSTKLDDFR